MNSTSSKSILIAIGVAILAIALGAAAQQPLPPRTKKSPQNLLIGRSRWRLATKRSNPNSMRIHVFRLRPGDDLLESIRAYAIAHHLHAAVVLTAVGSLTHASIRYANQPDASQSSGHFEIVSLVGTIEEGGEHLHLSLAAENGTMIGGHLDARLQNLYDRRDRARRIAGRSLHARIGQRRQRLGGIEGLSGSRRTKIARHRTRRARRCSNHSGCFGLKNRRRTSGQNSLMTFAMPSAATSVPQFSVVFVNVRSCDG